MSIVFQDPPKRARGRSEETAAILEALRGNPGRWALIKPDVSVAAGTYWKRNFKNLEVRSSGVGKPRGVVDLYARWVGDA